MVLCDNHYTDPVVAVHGLNECLEERGNDFLPIWRRTPQSKGAVAEIVLMTACRRVYVAMFGRLGLFHVGSKTGDFALSKY